MSMPTYSTDGWRSRTTRASAPCMQPTSTMRRADGGTRPSSSALTTSWAGVCFMVMVCVRKERSGAGAGRETVADLGVGAHVLGVAGAQERGLERIAHRRLVRMLAETRHRPAEIERVGRLRPPAPLPGQQVRR